MLETHFACSTYTFITQIIQRSRIEGKNVTGMGIEQCGAVDKTVKHQENFSLNYHAAAAFNHVFFSFGGVMLLKKKLSPFLVK